MKRIFKVVSFVILAMSIASCAVEDELTTYEKEVAALDVWVKTFMPELEEVEEGLYLKIYKADESTESFTYTSTDWVAYTYTCQTLDGDYFYNMYPDLSYQLGYFDFYTYFTPEVANVYDMDSSGNSAIIYAIGVSNPGDSIVLVGSSKYMYSGMPITDIDSRPSGYGGNTTLLADTPGILKLRYNEYITDIEEYNIELVQEYAYTKMNKVEADSVEGVSLMYLNKLVEFPNADTIASDTTVSVYYTGRFLDGFIFDTNIEEVARANNIYSSDVEYTPIVLSIASESYVEGFVEAIANMNFGELAEVVFTASLGYEYEVMNSGSTWIQAGTPLTFTIKVLEDDDDELDDETIAIFNEG